MPVMHPRPTGARGIKFSGYPCCVRLFLYPRKFVSYTIFHKPLSEISTNLQLWCTWWYWGQRWTD